VRIGIVTDSHLEVDESRQDGFHNPFDFASARRNLERAIERHRAAGVDAIALLGDLANAGDETSHMLGLALCEAAGLPVWVVPGNHDTDEELLALATRIGTRTGTAIRIPSARGESVDGLRLAGLSLQEVFPGRGWTQEHPEVDAWGDEPTLLLTHFAAISRESIARGAGLKYAGDVRNHAEIAAALRGRPAPTVVLHGHHHLRDAVIDGSVLQIGFASLIEPPHEAALLEVGHEGRVFTVRVHHEAIAPSAVDRLPILSPAMGAWQFVGGAWESC
jgi:DNA repair exonuclease SbcCD nuclease subunit